MSLNKVRELRRWKMMELVDSAPKILRHVFLNIIKVNSMRETQNVARGTNTAHTSYVQSAMIHNTQPNRAITYIFDSNRIQPMIINICMHATSNQFNYKRDQSTNPYHSPHTSTPITYSPKKTSSLISYHWRQNHTF